MIKKILILLAIVFIASICDYSYAQEEEQELYTPFYFPYTAESETWFQPFYHPFPTKKEGWIQPFVAINGEYDDNIYLTRNDGVDDWITNIQAGLVAQPNLGKNRLVLDYLADLNFFAENDGEDNTNHTLTSGLQLNFNDSHIDIINTLRDFSDRSGTEDVDRIDRTQDYLWPSVTFNFNKLDLLIGYNYRLEKYHSDAAIGTFEGQALTYRDLEREEHEGTLEAAWKLWNKTQLLTSFDFGTIDHDTGKKSNSDYYDVLIGLRGQPTAKSVSEARIGFRSQNYESYADDFESIIFNGSWLENFTDRDALRLDFKRTTNDTIFRDNAYYESTYFGSDYKHDFTEKLYGNIGASYQQNYYPTETTLDNLVQKHRKDHFWSCGAGLGYNLSEDIVVDLKYQWRTRDSNFSRYDYENNRISAGIRGRF